MHWLLSIIFTLFLCQSCGRYEVACNTTCMFDDVSLKTAQELEKEVKSLQLIGLGGASDEDVVKMKKLVFRVNGKIDRNRGTLLIHKIAKKYLDNVKDHDLLKDYLETHSFSYNNLTIVLIVYDLSGKEVLHPDYKYVNLLEGLISFKTLFISENGASHIETVEKIPYEEAIKDL